MPGFIQKYEWLSACTGIELHILPDGSYHGRFCTVSVDKNHLHLDSRKEIKGDFTTISKKLSGKLAIALSLTGKGVLIKQAPKIETVTEHMLHGLFPGLQIEEFYVQNFVTGNLSYIAITRKEIVDDIIKSCNENGIRVLSITFGPFAVAQVFSQLNLYGDQLIFDGHSVTYNDEYHWEEYSYTPGLVAKFSLKIGIETIADKYITAYATAFQLALFPHLDPINADIPLLAEAVNDYQDEKKFKLRGTLMLLFFFVALFINFFLLNYYEGKNKELTLSINQSSSDIEMVRSKEAEIDKKEKLIQILGWNRGLSYAWICDQIGQTIPPAIQLTELVINPVKTIKQNTLREEVFDTGKIKLSGSSNKLEAVNDLIYQLKDKPWIKQVNLERYEEDVIDSAQHFTITMRY